MSTADIVTAPVPARAVVRLRAATATDAALLLQWRNTPEIVALGSTQRPVTVEEHIDWFARTLHSDRRRLFVVLLDEQPAGQVRFDVDSAGEAEISVFLMAGHTGRGCGVEAIRQGCARAFAELRTDRIVALVRETNRFSISAFQKAGFVADPSGATRPGHLRFQLVR